MRAIRLRSLFLGASLFMAVSISFWGMVNACAAASSDQEQIIRITAKKFEFSPDKLMLKRGVPVVLEFISLDRKHGFFCPGLGLRTDILPDQVSRLRLVPDKTGVFPFHCDIFCGLGHGEMTGTITVEE